MKSTEIRRGNCIGDEDRILHKQAKIVCVMATHGRAGITTETIKMLQKQTHPLEILIVGSSESDKKVAVEHGCHYYNCKNRPLGDKWQNGIKKAKDLNPDAVMICGSDSWVSSGWCQNALLFLKSGFDLVGVNVFYACRVYPNEKVKIIKRGYQGLRVNMPMGTGRMFSKRILNKMQWQLFSTNINTGLDIDSYRKVVAKKGSIKIIPESNNVKLLTIKSTWESINSWETYIKSKKNKKFPDIEKPKKWLKECFPESIEALERVVENVMW